MSDIDLGAYGEGKGIFETGGTWCWQEGAYFSEGPDEIDPDGGHYGYPCGDGEPGTKFWQPGLHTPAAVVSLREEGREMMQVEQALAHLIDKAQRLQKHGVADLRPAMGIQIQGHLEVVRGLFAQADAVQRKEDIEYEKMRGDL